MSAHRLSAHYAHNAATLRRMADKAERTGQPVGGYFADELKQGASAYDAMSKAPADIAESMQRSGYARAMQRLAELRARG